MINYCKYESVTKARLFGASVSVYAQPPHIA